MKKLYTTQKKTLSRRSYDSYLMHTRKGENLLPFETFDSTKLFHDANVELIVLMQFNL